MTSRLQDRLCMLMHALLSVILGPRSTVVSLTCRWVYSCHTPQCQLHKTQLNTRCTTQQTVDMTYVVTS